MPDDRTERLPDAPGPDEHPTDLRQLGGRGWRGALRRVPREYQSDHLGDWAAALTYYGVLSVFPAMLVLMSVLGWIGPSVTDPLIRNVRQLAPGPARDLLVQALTNLQQHHAAAGVVGIIAIATALWSASGYIAAFIRAMNAVYDVPEGRPFTLLLPLRLGLTVATLLLLTVASILVVVSGRVADRVGTALGIGHTAVQVWQWGKWPLLLLLVVLLFALLYWAAPNARQHFRWVSPGGLLAVVLWIAVSALFALYVSHFGSYNRVYGSLAAVVVFLVWLWLSNLALLLGAELNAELERQRAIERGRPADEEPYMELRDTDKLHDDDL
ncbi:YihY/virulence factor BrkB family protein [Streptacidiphilus monticola]|uniref:YihY/virulence factor BrkB family protein n=1 Tax=Streptacidiphilus monticola TaxID=2161674 RepID=A0ABW1G0N9_9ACTN